MAARKLTAKQELFVREYLVDLNGAGAYKRAGYRVKNDRVASVEAARLLANPSIAAAVAAARAPALSKLEIKAERVLAELAAVAFADISQLLDFSGTEPCLRPAKDIPEAARRAIASIKVKRHTEGSGDGAREVEVMEFKQWDKLGALAKLAQHLGLLKDAGVNVNAAQVVFEMPDNGRCDRGDQTAGGAAE